jgi:hypothetical protein
MRNLTNWRGLVVRPADSLDDEDAQRDLEREPSHLPTRRHRSARHESAARLIKRLGRVIGASGGDK